MTIVQLIDKLEHHHKVSRIVTREDNQKMDMPELKDPYTWTPDFVKSHRSQCLPRLREINQLVIASIQRGEYVRASVLVECMVKGLATMDKALPDNYRKFIFSYSAVQGILALNVDPFDTYEGMGFSMVDNRGRTVDVRKMNRESGNKITRRSTAIEYFKNARDFAQTAGAKQGMAKIIRALERGENCDDLTPEEALIYLRDLDGKLSNAIHGGGGANRSHAAVRTSARRKGGKPIDFDDWMEMNGWDKDDLAFALRQVKRRRNIYGVLLLVPGLGILLMPFWLRAVWLTRAMRDQDIHADFRFPEKAVMVLWGLPTFFIYPIIIGWVIRWSNWGMGLKDPRGSVLNTIFWGGILLLLLWQMAYSIGPIPFILCAVLLAVFLVIRWCRRLGSPVPALVTGGLSVVALVCFLAFARADILTGTDGRGLSGWLPSFSDKLSGNPSSTAPDSTDEAAVAQAMLDVLDQAMANNDYGEVGLADVDGDGIKELLVACEPAALLYRWQDGQLTAKEVGVLAGGYIVWYLCQDRISGEYGLQYESIGGGDFGGGDTTYYYPSREICVGERTFYDDGGTVSEEHYYIEDDEVTKGDYLTVRKQHRTLEALSTDGWYERGVRTTFIRAELEVIRDGKTLQDISDEGLLAFAGTAVYDLPGMFFGLATGSIIPQDQSDYIVVNTGHDGFGEVRAYRVPDCTTAAEVESLVHDIWHKKVSRRYPVEYEAHLIEYTGQADDYYIGDLLQYNDAIYVVENYGLGDGGSECIVDWMISRTADEAVFQVHNDYSEYTLSLIYEDGIWKYGE